MCTDYHYDSEEERTECACLVEDRLVFLETCLDLYQMTAGKIVSKDVINNLKTEIRALSEAWKRNSWNNDPSIPGEE